MPPGLSSTALAAVSNRKQQNRNKPTAIKSYSISPESSQMNLQHLMRVWEFQTPFLRRGSLREQPVVKHLEVEEWLESICAESITK